MEMFILQKSKAIMKLKLSKIILENKPLKSLAPLVGPWGYDSLGSMIVYLEINKTVWSNKFNFFLTFGLIL